MPVLNNSAGFVIDQYIEDIYSHYMAEGENFNRLVSALSLDERHGLLEKLKGQSNISDEPLYVPEDERAVPAFDIETAFSRLPWYYRLWYFILGYFKSKPPVKIFEERQVSALGNKLEERAPGLYDYQNVMLLPLFYAHLVKLKDAAHFFYSALDMSVNRDRGAFFAFLGSLEMPDVHKRLHDETDPTFYAANHSEKQESEQRQMAFKAIDDAMIMVTEKYRGVMYFNARSLNCLMELSSYLYDRLIMSFEFDRAENGETCSAGLVRELLISLNNILSSLKVIPPMTLLESLFVFSLQEKAREQAFDIAHEMRILLTKAEESLAVIREFNRQVPLTWILRCSTRNMTLLPQEISGGEDWFAVYRDYWKKRVESLFSNYLKDHHRRELLESFQRLFNGKSVTPLGNVQTDSNVNGLPIKGACALSFLNMFYAEIFMPEINLVLRPILIDGDFQKKENHIEFAEAYNNFIKLDDEIKKFELEISDAGDYGKRYAQAKQDMSSLPVKRRKMQIVIEDASEDAEKILRRIRDASRSMISLLTGICDKETRGKYNGLANLAKLAGKDGNFIAGINEIIRQFQTALKLLDDIELMEMGR